ncbi:MAG: DUF3108 domain-containing protein [Elusimicrobia bacterium]|jgi:hypothetical protein|nr:DUF3108 domain-containing protein [Elusimicrobiota bacterium]
MAKIFKRKYLISVAACIFVLVLTASVKSADMPEVPWAVGEDLTFSIRWGFITAGYANMAVTEEIILDERPVYRIVTQARSAAFFDPFYKVRDIVESYIDKEKLHTVRYKKQLREGSYEKDTTIIYDHKNKMAYENGHKFEITEGVQDVLSALYYMRHKKLEVGKVYEFDVGTGKKLWPLKITVKRKEKIKVPAGKFKTYLVIPELREEGIFKAKGKLKVWLTADDKKIPVLMKSKIPVGSISAVLIDKKLSK